MELLRNVFYDYVRIKDCDTFELYALKAPSWKRHSPRLPRSLTCRVESLTAHVLHVNLLRYDFAVLLDHMVVIPLSSTHGKLYPGSAAPRRLPRSLTCCVPSLKAPAASKVPHHCLPSSFALKAPLSRNKFGRGLMSPSMRALPNCLECHIPPYCSCVL